MIKDYKLFLESNENIDSICKKYRIENYTINIDGTVDVDGSVDLSCRRLSKLPLKFGKVNGGFNCSENQLNSLDGSPNWVGGYFDCDFNQLTILENVPKYIGTYFSCNNNELVTLKGGPEVVIGTYYCRNNNLINFKGFPEYHDKHVDFYGNPVYKLLDKMCLRPLIGERWCKFIYWCNEYDVITDEGKVIPERMEEVYNKLDLEYED